MKNKPIKLFFQEHRGLKDFHDILFNLFINFDESLRETEGLEVRSNFETCVTTYKKEDYLIIRLNACFDNKGKGTIAEYAYQLYEDGTIKCYDEETFHCIGPSKGLYWYIRDCSDIYQKELDTLFKYLKKKIKKYSKKIEEGYSV